MQTTSIPPPPPPIPAVYTTPSSAPSQESYYTAPSPATVIIETQRDYASDGTNALLILLIGLFFCFPLLLCNLRYKNSPNGDARTLSNVSLILCGLISCAMICGLLVFPIVGAILGAIFSKS